MSINKFGLVYEGAITSNEDGKISLSTVNYKNIDGIEIVANIYRPANFTKEKKYPAVVVAHPNGGVKEQVSGLFAQAFAESGYISLAYDAAYQGESGGTPRQTDRPSNRIEDIRASLDYLETLSEVNINLIGALGICGGGGYVVETSKTDKRIKALATISLFNTGRVRRNGFKDSDVSGIPQRLEDASKARTVYAQTGEILYTGDLITHQIHYTSEQLAQFPKGLYRDGMQYYGDTHYHKNSQSRYTTMSLQDLMDFDVENNVSLINQPLFMMTGDISDTRYMTDKVFENATGTDIKKLEYIVGANHIETYWKEPFISQEKKSVISFFSTELKE